MPRWICPRCDREFGRVHQAHVCAPGITVEELLARYPTWVGEIYRAVIERIRSFGPVHEDAVNVGVFLKGDRKIAEFRPRMRSVQLWIFLPQRVNDPRIARAMAAGVDRVAHMIHLTDAEQVDDQLGEWLEESYGFNTVSLADGSPDLGEAPQPEDAGDGRGDSDGDQDPAAEEHERP